MTEKSTNPMDENPQVLKRTVMFRAEVHGKDEIYRVHPPELDLLWPEGGVTEYEFQYEGPEALLFVPWSGIFEPVNGQDQVFVLGKGKINKIMLRPKHLIIKDGHEANGETFPYAVYDKKFNTMAIGNSPPKMRLGP